MLNRASSSHSRSIKQSGRLRTFDDCESRLTQRRVSLAVIRPRWPGRWSYGSSRSSKIRRLNLIRSKLWLTDVAKNWPNKHKR